MVKNTSIHYGIIVRGYHLGIGKIPKKSVPAQGTPHLDPGAKRSREYFLIYKPL
uniref:Uncharacterized protein n=1 Tax=Candidatus Kentrum sp. UNK TaxID=2126344 RepID=A0A451AIF8_9GAMM|nr:MAG: hypothetical protein BECKUNK1418G_GA0071005_10704 [Candidatus Kentron sp. UNK]VFK70221.1 MAG: hypothetical protein BECKUNK1418H_GA0071006_10254 [Candidatus Kentron sp. UNK]